MGPDGPNIFLLGRGLRRLTIFYVASMALSYLGGLKTFSAVLREPSIGGRDHPHPIGIMEVSYQAIPPIRDITLRNVDGDYIFLRKTIMVRPARFSYHCLPGSSSP